jgi:hypothetical protein
MGVRNMTQELLDVNNQNLDLSTISFIIKKFGFIPPPKNLISTSMGHFSTKPP